MGLIQRHLCVNTDSNDSQGERIMIVQYFTIPFRAILFPFDIFMFHPS